MDRWKITAHSWQVPEATCAMAAPIMVISVQFDGYVGGSPSKRADSGA